MLSRYMAAVAAVSICLGTASAQLTAVGAVAPEHGFPTSYTDSGNTSLGPCLNNSGLCLLPNVVELLNPGQPFPANYGGTFPDEFFYWGGDSTMTVNGGGTALLVMALTGSFAGGVPLAGDQIVFGRIRLRIDNLQVGSNYRITTPYGVFNLVPTVAGRRSINFTQDIGIATPGVFTTALNAGIGPFLRWDSGLPIVDVAGNQYLGDPNIEHTVTGSPIGANFFRIEGPNAGGPGINSVQTSLFTIMGMMVTPAPAANFAANPTSGTAPLTVAFTNQSTGTINTFAWVFGDGGTAAVASPSHTYTTAGTFTVSLTVTGPGGSNTRTANNLITVNSPQPVAPVAAFRASPTSGVVPLNVLFTNQSTGTINTFAWNFGDGSTSTQASPSHIYTSQGSFTASLTVTGPGGSSSASRVITVAGPANLRIESLAPGTAGTRNTITVTGCTPNAQVFVLWSTAAGSAPIQLNSCNVITDLASPLILTQGRARNSSTLERRFNANRGLAGQTLRLQAVDSGNCAKSPVVVETF